MRIDVLIFKILCGSLRFFYEILYDMVCIIRNMLVYMTCSLSELPCNIQYYIDMMRVALVSIKIIYDAVGPDFEKIKHYNMSFKNNLQIRRDDDVLLETSIGLPQLKTQGLMKFMQNIDAGKIMGSDCDEKCKQCISHYDNYNKECRKQHNVKRHCEKQKRDTDCRKTHSDTNCSKKCMKCHVKQKK